MTFSSVIGTKLFLPVEPLIKATASEKQIESKGGLLPLRHQEPWI